MSDRPPSVRETQKAALRQVNDTPRGVSPAMVVAITTVLAVTAAVFVLLGVFLLTVLWLVLAAIAFRVGQRVLAVRRGMGRGRKPSDTDQC